ncbi:MAG TPA: GMC family oxidoreductase, partial [Gemmatimonadaceae bacterium]|nr:GMC family oxidoreductase [Gemmatimonadaceae bacterium]
YRVEEDPGAIRRQRIQSNCYAWPEDPRAFVDDVDNPYTTEPGRPFAWLRCRQVGGRMTVRRHGLQFYRFSDLDFKAGERDGASPSWPISLADVAPYYERVERWMRLRGTTERLPQLPDSVLAEQAKPNPALQRLASVIGGTWSDRRAIACRTASPPVPIVEALATGRCRLQSGAVVTQILTDPRTARASGVCYVDRSTRRQHEVHARIVVLCASSIESARLLLASATPQHPAGLANSSGLVGRFLMDHVHLGGINGDMPLAAADRRPAAWGYIPRFRNVRTNGHDFVRGYGVQVFLEQDQCAFTAFGEMLPYADNRVTLDPAIKDKWGVPAARISCAIRTNERALMRDAANETQAMMIAAGFKMWKSNTETSTPGLAIHEVGTARMSGDRSTGVLNSFCQSWDVGNLFVMDGSCFVTQGAQNPTLTFLALTARSCDYLLESMRTGQI